MYYPGKLKSDYNVAGVVIPPLFMLSLFVFTATFLGIEEGLIVLFIEFILYSLFSLAIYLRTRNLTFIASAIMQICLALFFATVPKGFIPFPDKRMAWFIYFCAIVVGSWAMLRTILKKSKFRGRELFELASQSIESSDNGFTERPRPSGKTEYSREQLLGFAEYLRRNLIAMPYTEDNRILFVPVKMGDEFSFIFTPSRFRKERSWIAFDDQGNVTVSISKKDYLDYKEELSFDQLCDNLGRLFISFMEYFKRCEEGRIVYKLNEVGLSFFS